MAIASKDTFLLDGGVASSTASWSAALCEINSYSDPEGDMETADTTTLSASARTSMNTIRAESNWTFEANFLKATLATLKALEGIEHWYAIYHGGTFAVPTGANGKTIAKGMLSVREKGAAVGDIVKMEVKISLTSVPAVS